jgi:hypothetical protein
MTNFRFKEPEADLSTVALVGFAEVVAAVPVVAVFAVGADDPFVRAAFLAFKAATAACLTGSTFASSFWPETGRILLDAACSQGKHGVRSLFPDHVALRLSEGEKTSKPQAVAA